MVRHRTPIEAATWVIHNIIFKLSPFVLHCPHLLTVPADVEVGDDGGAGQREHLVVGVARHAASCHQQRRRHEAERGVQDGALKYF